MGTLDPPPDQNDRQEMDSSGNSLMPGQIKNQVMPCITASGVFLLPEIVRLLYSMLWDIRPSTGRLSDGTL